MSPEYLAGLFDGEGCIDVQRVYNKRYTGSLYVRPRVRMCMSDGSRFLLERLHTIFGGHMLRRKGKLNQQDSSSLEWLSNGSIRSILTVILPHLILKREQAMLALWWLDHGSGRSVQSRCPGMAEARAAFAEELRAMKRDPQRLSERAVKRVASLMRQSDLHGDVERMAEMAVPLA